MNKNLDGAGKFAISQAKVALDNLEALVLFESSNSSGWPRITIYMEASEDDAVLQVFPNGRTWNIQRSSDAVVSPEVVDVLSQAKTAVMVKDANAANGYVSRDVLRFPFRIVDSQSQLRYNSWKEALEVLRTVVTETKKTNAQTPSGMRTIHEVTKRYLPDEAVEKALKLIEWANQENAAEKERVAEAKAAAA